MVISQRVNVIEEIITRNDKKKQVQHSLTVTYCILHELNYRNPNRLKRYNLYQQCQHQMEGQTNAKKLPLLLMAIVDFYTLYYPKSDYS